MSQAKSISDKYSRLEASIYVVSWVIVLSVPLLTQAYGKISGVYRTVHWHEVQESMEVLVPIFGLFLLNNFVLLPKLLLKKHKVLYALAIGACCALLWAIQTPGHPVPDPISVPRPPMEGGRRPVDMFHLTNLAIELCVVFANIAIKMYIQSMRQDVMLLNITAESMRSELESLKYQVSPHFLMNTLNNIQSLIEVNPERASHTLQELSKLMRYLLYENNSGDVALDKELEFMSNFISLMKIRYPQNVKIATNFQESGTSAVRVPPLLFISFVENAFKYGVSYTGESMITVNLNVGDDSILFESSNYINHRARQAGTHSGIGIANVRRRLELLYGSAFALRITDDGTLYAVSLTIPKKISNLTPTH